MMPEYPGYSCYLSADAVSFLVGLSKQKQQKIIDLAERIAMSPELIGDYQTTDAKGRLIDNILLDLVLFVLITLRMSAPAHAELASEPIPWSEIGARAGAEYDGDGLSIMPGKDGAIIHSVFQRLRGEATPEGLCLGPRTLRAFLGLGLPFRGLYTGITAGPWLLCATHAVARPGHRLGQCRRA
jgi:hypothetical protein